MKDEIKEILDKAKEISDYGADGKQHTRMFNQFQAKALLDYITNLQNIISDKEDTIQNKNECITAYDEIIKNRDKEITNLQKENERLKDKIKQYEDPEDLTLFYMWLDEKAKDKMKQLQEENKRLKNELERYKHYSKTTGIEELMEENNSFKEVGIKLGEELEKYNYAVVHYREEARDYKTRNEKAIELIYKVMKERNITGNGTLNLNELLDVLQGKSDE